MLRGFFTADTGAPSGAAGSTSAGSKNTDDEQQQSTSSEHMIPKSRFDEVNRELADMRKWRQEREQADAQATKKQQQEADKQAAAKGEFERLAAERQAKIDTLEQQSSDTSTRLQALTDAMEKQIKVRAKALPDELQAMIPDDADVLTRYELVGKAEQAAAKLVASAPTRTAGTPPGPRGNGAPSTAGQPDLVSTKKTQVDYSF